MTALSDVDLDGSLDVVVSSAAHPWLAGLEQVDCAMVEPLTVELERPADVLAVGDLDGDGNCDIVVSSEKGEELAGRFNETVVRAAERRGVMGPRYE